MPTYAYPGVYIEEIPSQVRAIAGVSTSDTAFVDFFARGPMNTAVRLTSFGDFERVFGGLDRRSEASYGIQQYYRNGGRNAWVVRVAAGTPGKSTRTLQGGSPLQNTLRVDAANEGVWGDQLQVAVVQAPNGRFNLVVREVRGSAPQLQIVAIETHLNLTMNQTDARYAVSAVNQASALVTLADVGLGDAPTATAPLPNGTVPEAAFQPLTGGADGNSPDSNALLGSQSTKTGMYALERIEPFIFNILCIPAAAALTTGMTTVYEDAAKFCQDKRAFLIVDIPSTVATVDGMVSFMNTNSGLRDRNAAIYFPRIDITDPLNENRPRNAGASGTMAGVYARIDSTRGVWKAPAGTEATLTGAALAVTLTDAENGTLNPLGLNVLRNFPIFGNVSWGARTLDGADQQASEWKYIPVRRFALYIEESLFQGTKWAVFEPNGETLWGQLRLNIGAFMQNLFRQGAFKGTTPKEAYFVKVDAETTTQTDIDLGVVNIIVGFAPLKPAEFVVIKIQQMTAQTEA